MFVARNVANAVLKRLRRCGEMVTSADDENTVISACIEVKATVLIICDVEIAFREWEGRAPLPTAGVPLAVLYNALHVPKTITWNQGWTHGWSPAGMAKWTVDGGFDSIRARDLLEGNP